MKQNETPSPPSSTELNEWAAREIMDWKRTIHMRPGEWVDENDTEHWDWQPASDWNCWRMVEEKMMKNPKLWGEYRAIYQREDPFVSGLAPYMKADLRSRLLVLWWVYQGGG